jgi:A/G-specific adenine glycosylase
VQLKKLHLKLLAWYAREKRDLPWRRSRDPYRIWISEIMLQQTRVEAVIPYYNRFLSNFPTVKELAEAEPDRLLNLWAGLGYYSRARNLQAAAREIMSRFGGRLPEALEDLRTLKGIGPYTAAAIASIAFGRPHSSIDGNLERVFARLLALKEDPKSAAGRARVEEMGEGLVRLGHPGEVNQAVMDLASAICLPREPRCADCPLAEQCEARRLGLERELPKKKKKAKPIEIKAVAWAVIHEGKLLLARRPAGEWLAGMWDLPWAVFEKEGPHAPLGRRFASCSLGRTITKHKIEFSVHGLQCIQAPGAKELKKLASPAEEYRWVNLEDLHGVNLPRPSERALEKLLAELR